MAMSVSSCMLRTVLPLVGCLLYIYRPTHGAISGFGPPLIPPPSGGLLITNPPQVSAEDRIYCIFVSLGFLAGMVAR